MSRKKYETRLREAEQALAEQVQKTREALATERQRLPDLEDAVETTKDALDDTEAQIRRGSDDVTGLDLATARANVDAAEMRYEGSQERARRYADWLGKVNVDKSVAEIVKDALLSRMWPGAAGYATFATKVDGKPDTLPALQVTQLDGGVGPDGVGQATVRVSWLRDALHAPMEQDRLRMALEASGFAINHRFGFDGMVSRSTADADVIDVLVGNVSDEIPAVTAPLTNVDGQDTTLALEINQSQDVEAEGVGARIVSADENDGIVTTVVRLSVAVKQTKHGEPINLGQIVRSNAERRLEKPARGLGRCIETKVVPIHFEEADERGAASAMTLGKHVYAAEFTYTARAAA